MGKKPCTTPICGLMPFLTSRPAYLTLPKPRPNLTHSIYAIYYTLMKTTHMYILYIGSALDTCGVFEWKTS